MTQNCEIYRDGDLYQVIEAIRREIRFASADAAAAIQHGLDSFGDAGGEVFLHRGDYFLDRPLRLTSGTTLRGSGRGTRLKVTAENPEGVAIFGNAVNAATVTALACEPVVTGSAVAGIVFEGCGDSRVLDVFVKDFGRQGIVLRKGCFLSEIRGCQLAGNREVHLKLDDLNFGRAGNWLPNQIANCTAYGGGKGIECDLAIVVNIIGCQFVQNRGCAIHVKNYSCSTLISGCRTFQIMGDAVVVESSHEVNITANTFCWHEGHGIVLENVIWGSVVGNNIIDTGSVNVREGGVHPEHDFFLKPTADFDRAACQRNGIHVRGDTRGVNVTGNSLFNWPHVLPMKFGISEEATCRANAFTGNNANAFAAASGLDLRGGDCMATGNQASVMTSLMPVQAADYLQVFQPEKLEAFVRSLSR